MLPRALVESNQLQKYIVFRPPSGNNLGYPGGSATVATVESEPERTNGHYTHYLADLVLQQI